MKEENWMEDGGCMVEHGNVICQINGVGMSFQHIVFVTATFQIAGVPSAGRRNLYGMTNKGK